jgi:hypothetical protein
VESKNQEDILKKGKMISSWYEFIVALKKQFYPLGYMQQAIMDWKNLRENRGKNVQDYTQEFRKRALTLGIHLYMQENLLKYIGMLHSYLRHTILMFNPTNLDEVCVQATHIESRGNNVKDNFSKKLVQSVEGKNKGKVK